MKTISVRLTEEEKEAFDKACKDQDITMSQALRKLIRSFMEGKEEDKE